MNHNHQPPKQATRKKRKSDNNKPEVETSPSTNVNLKCSEQQMAGSRTGRKKPHKLAGFLGMPLDILLKLARTSKELRRLLLNKSSVSIWKASFSDISDLPECPADMSEPAWANLLFSPYCQFCATHTKNVEWLLRLTLNKKWDELQTLGHINGKLDMFESFITARRERRKLWYLPSQYDKAMNEYKAIEGEEERIRYLQSRQKTTAAIFRHARLCKNWDDSQKKGRELELEVLRRKRLNAIVKRLEDLGLGEDIVKLRLSESLKKLTVANRAQRLTDKIWHDIKDEVLGFVEKKKKIRLEKEREALRLKRQTMAVEAFRSHRKANAAENGLMPELPDFFHFEPVKDLIEEDDDVEVSLASFESTISQLPALTIGWREQIEHETLEIIKKVRDNSTNKEVMAYNPDAEHCYFEVPDRIRFPNMHLSEDQLKDKLRLASTVFICKKCKPEPDNYSWYPDDWSSPSPMSEPLFYPQALGHTCLRLQSSRYDWEKHDDILDMDRKDMQRRKRWTCDLLEVDTYKSSKAELVVRFCGLDPAVATTEDMDRLELRLACRLCPYDLKTGDLQRSKEVENCLQAGYALPLLEWRAAVRHMADMGHGQADFIKFKREELSDEILQAEDNHRR
ncbi:hypothetical protein CPB84DRAFT_1841573 [Gymnopilus junonius]|uniref:F-box domain-containing protein n=1 Tax=Gymnopilus junonius TaxID=109634 RepID=A0A9P5P1C3_GYMJU|nr:hypothetical protein CPB84DRAFT_1841573 [Gymnopilus junonius]